MKPAAPDAKVAPGDPEAAPTEGAETVNDPSGRSSNPQEAAPEQVERSTDRERVRRVQAGDEAAFRELFDRYHRRAYAVAFGVVKNSQDALDIVQEAFVKVHRHIHNFHGSSSFYTWLYRIVMNLAIDHVRRSKNTKDLDYDDRVGRTQDETVGDGSLTPRILEGNPGKAALRNELSQTIQQALQELPEYHRAVILLREVEGLSYEEMARVLKVPKGTIMSRLFHARRKMQEALGDYLQGDLSLEE